MIRHVFCDLEPPGVIWFSANNLFSFWLSHASHVPRTIPSLVCQFLRRKFDANSKVMSLLAEGRELYKVQINAPVVLSDSC